MLDTSRIRLEERTCACGCGKTFRCMPSSYARFSSKSCELGRDVAALSAYDHAITQRGGRPRKSNKKPKRAPKMNLRADLPDDDEELQEQDELVETYAPPEDEGSEEQPDDDVVEREPIDGPELGTYDSGIPFCFDLQKLLTTRLLVTASSGGGKSYLLRKLVEVTFGQVQQIVFDVEGEFSSLARTFDIDLAGPDKPIRTTPATAAALARSTMESGRSLIVDLYEFQKEDREDFVGLFVEALMSTPKEHWRPLLVIVDEAHIFNPNLATKVASAKPLIDLATRGRKRGFSVVYATQRLSRLHKDTAAELLNKLVGRTSLDLDLKRCGDELGLRDASVLRSLRPGQFFASGPAFGDTVELATIGETQTEHGVHDQDEAPDEQPEAQEEEVVEEKKGRVCGVCGESGHDRRNCPEKDPPDEAPVKTKPSRSEAPVVVSGRGFTLNWPAAVVLISLIVCVAYVVTR